MISRPYPLRKSSTSKGKHPLSPSSSSNMDSPISSDEDSRYSFPHSHAHHLHLHRHEQAKAVAPQLSFEALVQQAAQIQLSAQLPHAKRGGPSQQQQQSSSHGPQQSLSHGPQPQQQQPYEQQRYGPGLYGGPGLFPNTNTPGLYCDYSPSSPTLSAYGRQKLLQVKKQKEQKLQRAQAAARCNWEEAKQMSIQDTTDLNQAEKEWLDQEEAQCKYDMVITQLFNLHTKQDKLNAQVQEINENLVQIKEVTTQLAQILLDVPPTASPKEETHICNQINSFDDNEMLAIEVWVKVPKFKQFLLDALIDTGSASSYIARTVVPHECILPLTEKIQIFYANNKKGVISHYCSCRIAIGQAILPVQLLIHEQQNCDILIGNDIIMKILPFTLHTDKQLTFTHNNTIFAIQTKSVYSLLVGTISPTYSMPMLPMQNKPRFLTWFSEQKERYKKQLEECQQKSQTVCSEDPLAFWDKEQYFISLPTITDSNPTKASHTGMNLEDTKLCEQEISELLERGLIQRTNSPWAC